MKSDCFYQFLYAKVQRYSKIGFLVQMDHESETKIPIVVVKEIKDTGIHP